VEEDLGVGSAAAAGEQAREEFEVDEGVDEAVSASPRAQNPAGGCGPKAPGGIKAKQATRRNARECCDGVEKRVWVWTAERSGGV